MGQVHLTCFTITKNDLLTCFTCFTCFTSTKVLAAGSGNAQQQAAGMQAPQTRGQAPAGKMPANGPSNGRKAAVQWDDDIPF
jgi:hypothetical protein